ncbi:unnamed protein product, partial [Pylaiella littoralis]
EPWPRAHQGQIEDLPFFRARSSCYLTRSKNARGRWGGGALPTSLLERSTSLQRPTGRPTTPRST